MRYIKERTFVFAVKCVKLCQELEKSENVARTLTNQLLRSSTSVGANVEEAHAAQSRADFISKNAIALKEARETIYWLRLLQATEISNRHEFTTLQIEATEISRILGAIIVSTERNAE